MKTDFPDMLDLVFELDGGILPKTYPFALWNEVVRILPWLAEEELAGILPLRGSISGEEMLLPRRARLALRLPAAQASRAAALSGQELEVQDYRLHLGGYAERALQPYPTLHAHMVESADKEDRFLAMVAQRLDEMEVVCKWICGMRQTLFAGESSLSGYSLVLHDLKPEASLQIQRTGLGGNRRYGCGLFVPHKEISGLD